ncbi:MAG: hypothetical protein U0176_07265 [Bacteroidia bacterium]
MGFVQVSLGNGLNEESAEDEVASLHRTAICGIPEGEFVNFQIGNRIEHEDAQEHPHVDIGEFWTFLVIRFKVFLDFLERQEFQVFSGASMCRGGRVDGDFGRRMNSIDFGSSAIPRQARKRDGVPDQEAKEEEVSEQCFHRFRQRYEGGWD